MAKEKNSSYKSAPTKTATKQSPAQKTAPGRAVTAEIAAAAASASAPAGRTQPAAAELYEEIRRRAYEFYCARGGHHGSHEADWHRAELEVRSKYK
jgi:hypothetical protein